MVVVETLSDTQPPLEPVSELSVVEGSETSINIGPAISERVYKEIKKWTKSGGFVIAKDAFVSFIPAGNRVADVVPIYEMPKRSN